MIMLAYYISENTQVLNEMKVVQPKNGRYFQLQELYELLHCEYVELVTLTQTEVMIVDESGRINNRPKNKFATEIYLKTRVPKEVRDKRLKELEDQGFSIVDMTKGEEPYIAGDVIICPKYMLK